MGQITKMPTTKTVNFGGLTLECRLTGRAILNIEKRLDESLMGLFIKNEGEMKLPPANKVLIVLHLSNTVHGVKESDVVKAFENFIDDGGNSMELFGIVQDLLGEAGFFGKSKDKAESEDLTLDNATEEESIL